MVARYYYTILITDDTDSLYFFFALNHKHNRELYW